MRNNIDLQITWATKPRWNETVIIDKKFRPVLYKHKLFRQSTIRCGARRWPVTALFLTVERDVHEACKCDKFSGVIDNGSRFGRARGCIFQAAAAAERIWTACICSTTGDEITDKGSPGRHASSTLLIRTLQSLIGAWIASTHPS